MFAGSDSEDELSQGGPNNCFAHPWSTETQVNPTPTTKVTDLPQELLLDVFSYLMPNDLANCARICREWNDLAYDPSLWREVHPVEWAQGRKRLTQLSFLFYFKYISVGL